MYEHLLGKIVKVSQLNSNKEISLNKSITWRGRLIKEDENSIWIEDFFDGYRHILKNELEFVRKCRRDELQFAFAKKTTLGNAIALTSDAEVLGDFVKMREFFKSRDGVENGTIQHSNGVHTAARPVKTARSNDGDKTK